jgi:predicted phosphodiesterase
MSHPARAVRVAVLADVHGNTAALEAALVEIRSAPPDLVVFVGDLTWGPQPQETLSLLRSIETPTVFIRGNADRAVLELADASAPRTDLSARERWMIATHPPDALEFLRGFVDHAVVDIVGLGPVRFCHGSPRSDEELVTPETPAARIRELTDEIPERIIVTAHTHLQFDRQIAGIRSINPGSIGMPYAERPGAYWTWLGPDVELRRSEYDVAEAVRRYGSSRDPLSDRMIELLMSPPTPADVIADAERLVFSG